MFKISAEVREAIAKKRAVVALESSIISQGMPYPTNIETALACESIVREHGAIPATIAVLDGAICVGLGVREIEVLAKAREHEVYKLSSRDLPVAIAKKLSGGTTVSASVRIAKRVGIDVFSTGGIGGVHRDGENSLDISADLEALASCSLAVVCAGVKSILDVGRTLEVLETKQIPVIGYRTKIFPLFYCRTSPYQNDYEADSVDEIAHIIRAQRELSLPSSIVITNPIPEGDSLDEMWIEQIVHDALVKAKDLGIRGKAVTPFLLSSIAQSTDNKSLRANCALVKNNARLGAELALALAANVDNLEAQQELL